jgi:hypothetical protein
MHNKMIHAILAQYKELEEQEEEFRLEYQQKIDYLSTQLLSANQQEEALVADLGQYSQLVQAMDASLTTLQQRSQTESLRLISEL